MALRLGPITIPWREAKDPYWDLFVNRPVNDRNNLMQEALRSPGGAINPAKTELHTPEITSDHLRQLALFLGAESMGVVRLKNPLPAGSDTDDLYSFVIAFAIKTDYDPHTAQGVGGQTAVRNGRFVTFTMAAFIREMGYRATNQIPADQDRLAAAAGLGTLRADGRLVTSKSGAHVHIADEVIHTNLPIAPDGEA
jgi:hypothetical protein